MGTYGSERVNGHIVFEVVNGGIVFDVVKEDFVQWVILVCLALFFA